MCSDRTIEPPLKRPRGDSVPLTKAKRRSNRSLGPLLVAHMRGRATGALSTDDIMRLTRRRVMHGTLVDANVLIDIFTEDEAWMGWPAAMLEDAAESGLLYINPIAYAEVSLAFTRIEDLDDALPRVIRRAELPWDAGFLATKVYARYWTNFPTLRVIAP